MPNFYDFKHDKKPDKKGLYGRNSRLREQPNTTFSGQRNKEVHKTVL